MFVDTHCHLYDEYYSDLDKVINDAASNNVTYYINNGCDNKSNIEVLEKIKKYPSIYGAIGIHPENVDNYTEKDISFIEENIKNEKIVAIGEIGLDYHYTKGNKDAQIRLFEKQLEIAEKYQIPVIIHSRDATEDTINVLKKYHVTGTIHSFSGSLETAKIYIKMGFMLGVNGVLTFKNAKVKDILKDVGLENIILETDSPYLTPEPFRGSKNDPSHILDIAKFMANLYDISLEDLSKIVNKNILKTYKKLHISM